MIPADLDGEYFVVMPQNTFLGSATFCGIQEYMLAKPRSPSSIPSEITDACGCCEFRDFNIIQSSDKLSQIKEKKKVK